MSGSEEIDPASLEKTRKELGAIIKAPKLSDKLLKKPPFRFLHDIVTNVIKTSGFATKLYTSDEMDSTKVQEKDAKVHFLQKIISSVNYTLKLQPPLAAKPIKIVSGLEPQATNEFLQKLAAATKIPIEKSDKAVSKVLSRFADKAEQARRESAAGDSAAKAAEEAAAAAAAAAAATAQASGGDVGQPEAQQAPPQQAPQPVEKPVDEKPVQQPAPSKDDMQNESAEAAPPPPAEKSQPAQPTPIERREEKAKPKEAKQETVKGPQGVMVEGEKKEGKGTLDTDSEDEQDPTEVPVLQGGDGTAIAGGDGDGYLARLAAAKKADEEEKQRIAKEAADRLGQEEGTEGIRLQTTRNRGGKEREVFSTEVSKLKDSLQSLVKVTNPLGKTFEYLQEDLDSMSREKAVWQRQAQDTKVQAQEAEHATEESLQPLYSQIQDLEDAISDQLNKIHTTRANILKNDQIVETLLRMVAS